MFRSEGAARSDRLNRLVAGYLAFIGGYVNSCGVVYLGLFTSHVTGNIGRAALGLATLDFRGAASAFALVLSFYGGALGAHLLLDSSRTGATVSRRYGVALGLESLLIMAFAVDSAHAFALCAAMGLQNSLVTRLSGAIVRTTHLTGVVTDLGIETARWIRHWRRRGDVERPPPEKIGLLATIAGSFAAGAIAGSLLALHASRAAFIVPAGLLALAAFYARSSRD